MIYWLYLLGAMIFETIGTLSMQWANLEGGHIGYVVMYVCIALSYYLLSLAVTKIALGVAYALWEGIGLILITILSLFIFNEAFSLTKALGLLCIVIGVFLVKGGTSITKHPSTKHTLQEV